MSQQELEKGNMGSQDTSATEVGSVMANGAMIGPPPLAEILARNYLRLILKVPQEEVPSKRVEEFVSGLRAVLGSDNDPEQRLIRYIRFKTEDKERLG